MTIRLIHETDLFHPHGDPDDHFDLACVYALAYKGDIELSQIVIDYPPAHRMGDPDVIGIGQMNYITGMNVPVAIGTPIRMCSRNDMQPEASVTDHNAINRVLNILRTSSEKVAITVVGACHDIAIAGKKEPELFRKKCAAIYLNAGSGAPQHNAGDELEYNVKLNTLAFAAIFDLPCPIYWLPCYHKVPTKGEYGEVGEFGTMYRFRQNEILHHLSPRVKNYFLYMLSKSTEPKWLRYLEWETDEGLLEEFGLMYRRAWSTASFLHAAEKTVTLDGDIVDLNVAGKNMVYTFEPIRVSCSDEGITTWEYDNKINGRYIFRVNDTEKYAAAMTKAMRDLLKTLS
jgi:hypothetical protein